MNGSELTLTSFWWIIPIVMMGLCFLVMRKRRGSTMCCFGPRGIENYQSKDSDTAEEILNKRYASGEIGKDEFEEIKKTITGSADGTLK